jgi:hypothetical protein
LYFVFGWSVQDIADRYGYSGSYVKNIVNEWKQRAAHSGYLQRIPPKRALLDLKRAATGVTRLAA